MKKVILTLALIILTVVYFSCSNQENDVLSKDSVKNTVIRKKELKVSDYGKIHNEIITLYHKEYGYDLENVRFETILRNELTLMQNKYPEYFNDINIDESINSFRIFNTTQDLDFSLYWKNYKTKIMKKGEMSPIIISFIDDISKNNYNYQTLKSKVEDIKYNFKLNENEIKQLAIFTSVLESSNQLWNINSNSNLKSGSCCNNRVILMDAAGTLMFLATGPIATINGAACSLAAANSGCCNQ